MPSKKLNEVIDLAKIPSQRLIFVFRIGSFFVIALGTGWLVFYALKGWWPLFFVELILPTVGIANLFLLRRRLISLALYGNQVVFGIFIILYCLLLDLPSEVAPRSAHLYLPVLALLGYLNYRWKKTKLQAFMILISLGVFLVFNLFDMSFSFAYPIPKNAKPLVACVNNILALTLLCGGIYAMQLQFFQIFGLAKDLHSAIQKGELELFYQPQVDDRGKITGAEALLRWHHPELGYIMPGHFIPIAEQSGLIQKLGGWVLVEACRTLKLWQQNPATANLNLSINVSAEQFLLADFEDLVISTLNTYGVSPANLTLELTESIMATNIDEMREKLQKVKACGVLLALDDFGTGYSSLSYLRALPMDILKIDRSFIISAQTGCGATLVKNIVQMGADLNLTVVAEGVETEDQFLFLRNCGCKKYQGYYFGKPAPRLDFEKMVRPILPPPSLTS